MTINDLNKKQIQILSSASYYVDSHGGYSKTIKWAKKHILDDELNALTAHLTDEEFISLVHECRDVEEQWAEEKKKAFFDTEGVDSITKSALWSLISSDDADIELSTEGDCLVLDTFLGAECRISFEDWSISPKYKGGYFHVYEGELKKDGDTFELILCANHYDTGNEYEFTLRFKEARTTLHIEKRDYLNFISFGPWEQLSATAAGIIYRHDIFGDMLLNEKEKELLPLLKEIARIRYNYDEFPLLKGLFAEYGYQDLIRLLEKVENKNLSIKKRCSASNKLNEALDDCKHEALWRRLKAEIDETEKDYPSPIDDEAMAKARAVITKELKSLGYEGVYPAFTKRGSIKGIHLAKNHGTSYFVGAEKDVCFHIYCAEYEGDGLTVEFLCGTEILRGGKEPTDIFSCAFRDKSGKRYVKSHGCRSGSKSAPTATALKKACIVADKRARLLRLNKEERAIAGTDFGTSVPLFRALVVAYAMAGLVFGALFTPFMMAIDAISTGSLAGLADWVWLKVFLGASLGFGFLFGVAMTIIARIAKRK